MHVKRETFTDAREQVRVALAEIGSGAPEPYIDCWASSDDATLFGAWGPIEKGRERLTNTFRWVGGRFTGGALVPEDVVSRESGDLAYTVGFERGHVSVDGAPACPMTIRVTHIYRRIDGEWHLIHRHADFPPADQRVMKADG
jgi:ketosteroid isomerase-like protein